MWLRGDFHVHSTVSDGGEQTPAELAALARELGLHVLAGTEHNTTVTHAAWAAEAGDDLLVLLGQETTTPLGHWVTLPGLRVAAHPVAPYPGGTMTHPLTDFDLVEVWNGPWTSDVPWQADNEAALALWARTIGTDDWRPAIGNSDTHLVGQLAIPHTVVRAEAFTANAVVAGLRAGHSWIAGAPGIGLTFEARSGNRRAGPGDHLDTAAGPAEVRVTTSGLPDGGITLHTDAGQVAGAPVGTDHTWQVTGAYVRAEVRHPDGRMAALTNPIRLGR